MSTITKDTLKNLEKLACLPIKEAESKEYIDALEKVLGMFSKMAEISTENVDHLSIQPSTTLDGRNIRKDEINNIDNSSALEKICPKFNSQTGNIIVAKVVDK